MNHLSPTIGTRIFIALMATTSHIPTEEQFLEHIRVAQAAIREFRRVTEFGVSSLTLPAMESLFTTTVSSV
jgi:hypothetical protein